MDPITISAVVLAIVSGAAGEAGAKLWDGLTALVRRPAKGRKAHAAALEPSGTAALEPSSAAALEPSGEVELAAVQAAPADRGRALELANRLVARAGADADFATELRSWLDQAQQVTAAIGNVTNTISGGTQHGPVIQGRDFGNLTFNMGPPNKPSE
jgi:hypothetical protein